MMESRPVSLLSLDIGTHTGWMLRLPDGQKHIGSWKFPSGQPTGNRLLSLFQSLCLLLKQHGCMDHEVRIAVESVVFTKNPGSQVLGTKLIAAVEIFASTYGFPPPQLVTISEWRFPFLKFGGFLEKPKAPPGTKDKTAWYKAKTIEQCNRLGLDPKNDNEGDAIGIGFWLHNGGVQRQKARNKAKRYAKQQKRAQEKLDL